MKKILFLICLFVLASVSSQAQINHNTCKFLGNITTYGQIQPNAGDLTFEGLWDQLTCENESQWGNIVKCKVSSAAEGVQKWNWRACDAHYQWCKDHGVLFKFSTLLCASHFPSCLKDVTGNALKQQIEYWFDAVAIKYPDVAIIDVVSEAIKGHGESNYKVNLRNALGSSDSGDYTWVAEAFNMARQRFPYAVLVYNDYNTFTDQKSQFIDLVSNLVQRGAPIDAYGHQAHDLEEYYSQHGNSMSGFESNLNDIHNQITQKGGRELQCYITELDIDQANNDTQLDIMRGAFPAMWEADFVSGITLWGYVSGKTWQTNSGLVTGNGEDRPSMTWLRQYMATDIAKGVSANFCGKDAGSYTTTISIEASKTTVALGESVVLKVNSVDVGIKSVIFYAGDAKIGVGETITWTPESVGNYRIKAVALTGDDREVVGYTLIQVVEPNKPYMGTAAVIPGKIEAENYDEGVAGFAYYDTTEGNQCYAFTNYYRKDDVDIKAISDGVAVGAFAGEEWMAYTVDVQKEGIYTVSLRLSEGDDAGSLAVSFDKSDVAFNVNVGNLGGWDVFKEVQLEEKVFLKKGLQTMTIKNTGSWIDFDWIRFDISEEDVYIVYTEFDESTGTLTYYYDNKREERTGVTELYDPENTPDAVRFTGYYTNVLKAVIDPSMKNAPLTSLKNMFYGGVDILKPIDLTAMTTIEGLENLNTINVTTMRNMFGGCYSLATIDLSSFNTAKVTDMQGMFSSCRSLTSVDVSSFDISNVTEMRSMFIDCPALTTIYCSNDWSTSTAQSGYMFSGCTSLIGGEGTVFDKNVIDNTYARPDGGTSAPGYFTEKPTYLVGDANGNGEVEIGDVTSVLTLMATPEATGYNNKAADANGNGEIEIGDVTTILTIMANGN